ncbi:MAG: hypothetical protein HYZ22_09190, partial [Chloroflexi bacterium]|nr:hypothetical protein [Chloroflexota bacterium]
MKRTINLMLLLTFAMTACNSTASPPTLPAPDSVSPIESTPTPSDAAQGAPDNVSDYAVFSINVQDFSYPQQSATV